MSAALKDMRAEVLKQVIDAWIPPQSLEEQWNVAGLEEALEKEFGLALPIRTWLEADSDLHEEPLRERISAEMEQTYAHKEAEVGSPLMRQFEKAILLQVDVYKRQAEESSELYRRVNEIIPRLTRQKEEEGPGDYWVDEKTKQVYLTEDGHQQVEDLLVEMGLLHGTESLYDAANLGVFHHLNACLRAHALFHKDVEYICLLYTSRCV